MTSARPQGYDWPAPSAMHVSESPSQQHDPLMVGDLRLTGERPQVRPRLRVGLLVDSLIQPKWVYEIVAVIQRSPFARVVLIVRKADGPPRGLIRRIWNNRHRFTYALYTRLDDFLFRQEPDAFMETSIADLVSEAPAIAVQPIKKRFSDYFPDGDIAAIRHHDLDVALRFGFRILRGDALSIARYGVWSYHHGDTGGDPEGPPGFWEVMERRPVTRSALQILTPEFDNARVICRSYALTDTRSVRRNQNSVYWKSAAFAPRKLRDLHDEGPAALRDHADGSGYTPDGHPLRKEPGNAEMVRLAARLCGRYAADKLRELVYLDQWSLAYRIHPNAGGPDTSFHRFTPLAPPRDRFWADPFPVRRNGRYYIFVEELFYRTNKGRISVLELDERGSLERTATVLERDHHLSYPFLFEWDGHDYLVPESGRNGTVELYRSTAFPGGWEPTATLLHDVYACDATLAEIDGAWWMFVTIAVDGALNNDELHLFFAPTPLGPWRPHRRNPVKSDARSARPAGRIFRSNGNLYRPSQICSGRYGAGIVINRIHRLSAREYEETEVSRIQPTWAPGLLGTHTLNGCEGMTVLDVLVRRRRILGP